MKIEKLLRKWLKRLPHPFPAKDRKAGFVLEIYQLRRLRLRGLITRIPGTQRYEVTDSGQRMALFWLGSMSKTIRPLATSLTDETVQQKILIEIKKTIERNAMAAANSKT